MQPTLRRLMSDSRCGVESIASPRHRHENFCRLESPREPVVEIFQSLHEFRNADRVHVSKRATAERRESKSEYRSDIAIARRANHVLSETSRCFVEQRKYCALLNLQSRNLRTRLHLIPGCCGRLTCPGSKQRVYAL